METNKLPHDSKDLSNSYFVSIMANINILRIQPCIFFQDRVGCQRVWIQINWIIFDNTYVRRLLTNFYKLFSIFKEYFTLPSIYNLVENVRSLLCTSYKESVADHGIAWYMTDFFRACKVSLCYYKYKMRVHEDRGAFVKRFTHF